MGTLRDWGLILVISVVMGLYGWARTMGIEPYPDKLGRSLAGWILLSAGLGIWFTFSWQAVAVPLVFITVPAVVAGVILIYFARPRGGQPSSAELSADKHKQQI